ncbi:hypothetical protein [Nostoc sp.]|uniref:hypothetical protein n=1 Tax=Nostoc sp. TaxID=1180 RepID=UPI003FA57F41
METCVVFSTGEDACSHFYHLEVELMETDADSLGNGFVLSTARHFYHLEVELMGTHRYTCKVL